jgi:maltose O-acetyltransferase
MTTDNPTGFRESRLWASLGSAHLAAVNWLLRLPGHAFRIFVLRRLAGWTVGSGTSVGRRCVVMCRGRVVVGSGCVVNQGVVLDGRGGLRIGDDVEIASGVRILTASHDVTSPDFRYTTAGVVLGDRVWLATEALVLPGVAMGDGSVAAARAVVSSSVDPAIIVGGVPARRIGTRPAQAQTEHQSHRRFWH